MRRASIGAASRLDGFGAHAPVVFKFLKFAFVGAITFVVDALAFLMLHALLHDVYAARCLSFVVALTFSWGVNRRVTFADGAGRGSIFAEWLRFALSNTVGGLVNLAVSLLLVRFVEVVAHHPILAVGAGSLAGLAFNFLLTILFVFPARRAERNEDG